jgi:hypothetical protein
MIFPIQVSELPGLKDRFSVGDFFEKCGVTGGFKYDHFIANWESFLNKDLGAMWKAVDDNFRIIGLFGGLITPDLFSGEPVAMGVFWYVLPEHRNKISGARLLFTFEVWAKRMEAKAIIMAHLLNTLPAQVESYYEARGYRPLEIHYVKRI